MSMRERLYALGVVCFALTDEQGTRIFPTGQGGTGSQPPGGGSPGDGGTGSGSPPGYKGPPGWKPQAPPPGTNNKTPGTRIMRPNEKPAQRPQSLLPAPPAPPPTIASHPTPQPPPINKRTVNEDAPGALIPVIYGQKGNVAALFPYRATDNTGRYLYCIWVVAMGPINAITNIMIDGHSLEELGLVSGVSYNVYTGTASQTVDPLISGNDATWLTGLPGIAYIAAKLDGQQAVAGKIDPTKLVATVNGMLVRDPRNNPNAGTAPTAAAGGAGSLTGYYDWNVTFVDGSGFESPGCSVPSNAVTLSSQQGSLTVVPTGPAGTASRNIYRRIKTDPNAAFRLTGSIANNTGTTFTDTTTDANLGVEIPYTSTQLVYSTNPVLAHADFRTSRRYGFNDADAQQDWTSIANAANDCDFAIASPGASPASAPTATLNAPSGLTTGGLINSANYAWCYTFVTGGIESGASAPSTTHAAPTTGSYGVLTGILTGPAGTTSRRIYRNKGVSSLLNPKYLVAEIFDNTTTTFTDYLYDYQLQPTQAPSTSPANFPRYGISAWLAKAQTIEAADNQLRANYSGYLSFDTQWHFFVDLARSASAITFDTTNIVGEIDITTMGLKTKYARVVVTFDDAQNGYKQATAVVEHPNWALPPTELDRIERNEGGFTLDVPNYDQAKRLATQIFNRSRINKQVKWVTMQRGIRAMPGIVVLLTHPTGPLSSTPVIVTDISLAQGGLMWQFTGEFYDATVYLDTPQYNGNPIIPPDPSPFAGPPPPYSCSVTEVDYYGNDGQLQAKLDILWTTVPTPFYLGTRIDFSFDGGVTWNGTGGLHAAAPFYLEDVKVNVAYLIRIATVLTTLVQSDYIQLSITPTLLGGIQDVTQLKVAQNLNYGATAKWSGPIPSVMLAPRNQPPAAAPNLSLSAGGIVPTGSVQVMYTRVTAQTETLDSPIQTITVTSGNQILNWSNVLDSDGSGGGTGVLYKKLYWKLPGWSDFNWVSDVQLGVTSGGLNSNPTFVANLVPPKVFDGIDHWLISDNSFNPPNPLYTVPYLSMPDSQNLFAIPAAVYANPSTGLPVVNILVQAVDKLGNVSPGVASGVVNAAWPHIPQDRVQHSSSTLTLANGANNNIAITTAGIYFVSGPTLGFQLGGFTGMLPGDRWIIVNTTAQTMTIKHNLGGNTYPILVPGAADKVSANQYSAVEFYFDGTNIRPAFL